MRAFLALDLPAPMILPLTRLQAGLTVGRVMPEENLHLTLAFLDEVSDGVAHEVAEALDGARLGRVMLSLSGLALFGGHRPKVLAVNATGEGLVPLHDKVMRIAREAGVILPRERFRPHVTIARFAREIGARGEAKLGEFLALNGTFSVPPEPALAVTLFRSHLTHEGAHHEPLASFPLTG